MMGRGVGVGELLNSKAENGLCVVRYESQVN